MFRISLVVVCCISVLLATPVVSHGKEADAPLIAKDSRIVDAIAAWSAWVEYQLAINNVPGTSVGVVHDQELLYAEGFGFANPATGKAAGPDTIYSICSNSKLFTSIGILQLRDAGKLRLDDEIEQIE